MLVLSYWSTRVLYDWILDNPEVCSYLTVDKDHHIITVIEFGNGIPSTQCKYQVQRTKYDTHNTQCNYSKYTLFWDCLRSIACIRG